MHISILFKGVIKTYTTRKPTQSLRQKEICFIARIWAVFEEKYHESMSITFPVLERFVDGYTTWIAGTLQTKLFVFCFDLRKRGATDDYIVKFIKCKLEKMKYKEVYLNTLLVKFISLYCIYKIFLLQFCLMAHIVESARLYGRLPTFDALLR